MLAVIVDYGRIVKKFHSATNAQEYFEKLAGKHHHLWIVNSDTAMKLGFI